MCANFFLFINLKGFITIIIIKHLCWYSAGNEPLVNMSTSFCPVLHFSSVGIRALEHQQRVGGPPLLQKAVIFLAHLPLFVLARWLAQFHFSVFSYGVRGLPRLNLFFCLSRTFDSLSSADSCWLILRLYIYMNKLFICLSYFIFRLSPINRFAMHFVLPMLMFTNELHFFWC